MTISYTTGIPAAANNPSVDQPVMQQNTNAINNWAAVDHAGFNVANGGNHSLVHLIPQTAPAAVVGLGEIYSKTVGSDQQLFYQSGGGIITQLTGTSAPVAGTNGYVYLAGGILLQWGTNTAVSSGSFASGSAEGTITFSSSNIAFPTNCFMVNVTLFNNGSSLPNSAGSVSIAQSGSGALNNLGFGWTFNSGSSKYTGFYWMAIGN